MVNSAIILHYKRLKVYKDFWFMQPYTTTTTTALDSQPTSNVEQHLDVNANIVNSVGRPAYKCVHGQTTCSKFIWNGIKVALACGLPIDLLGALMKGGIPKGCRNIWTVLVTKMKTFRPNMAGFFVMYAGIYRVNNFLKTP